MKTITRVDRKTAESIYDSASFIDIIAQADEIRRDLHPDNVVTFVVDRNINYTNVCVCKCKFCAFYRVKGDPEGYTLSYDTLSDKIQETIDAGGTQILLQGGLHPDLKIDWYEDLLKFIKGKFNVWVHGFSAPEIAHIASVSSISYETVIKRLVDSGLDSIPGGGAEMLVDNVRKEISPSKIDSFTWLDIMRTAHKQGLKTTATMMFRKGERTEDIIEHLLKVRDLQDETNGFTAFIPWPFQPGNTELGGVAASAVEYLKVLAISRIVLDNIPNIQVSWVSQGEKVGQMGLYCGGNDFGSVMMEENVVKAAGVGFRLTADQIVYQIKEAGFTPKIRNMLYEIIKEDL